MRRFAPVLMVAVALCIMGVTTTVEQPPVSLDFDEVTVGTSVTALTDQGKSDEVMIRNRSDQILCVKIVLGKDDCSGVTMTCSADAAASIDADLWVIGADVTDTMVKPIGSTLCGKQPAASGNTKVIRVVETVK